MARRKKTNEDEPKENSENINDSDDNFGLPEIEYQPLNRDEHQEEVQEELESVEASSEEHTYTDTTIQEEIHDDRSDDHVFNQSEERSSSSASKVLGIALFLILIGTLAWFFMIYKPKKIAEEKARQEEIARAENAKRQQEELRLAELKRQEEERRIADSIANAVPKIGTIETLSGRTGRYYVIVASDIDDDLIMDYAKKLSVKGVSSRIVPPFGKGTFSRISVADADTYGDAQSAADSLTNEYPGGAWVIRY